MGWLAALALWSGASAFTARHGRLTVTYADPRDRGQLGAVFRAFDAAVADLRGLGVSVPASVRVVAASGAADFAARTGEPAGIAASTLGSTIRTQRLSALAARGLLPVTIRHETFHTAQPKGIERWRAEGLARTFSGEAARDPGGPTGLEALSEPELDAALQDRNPARLSAAYREASRRVARLLRTRSWGAVMQGH